MLTNLSSFNEVEANGEVYLPDFIANFYYLQLI